MNTPPVEKFRLFRNKRYYNPLADCESNTTIKDLKTCQKRAFSLEDYHMIEPKKPSAQLKDGRRVIEDKGVLRKRFEDSAALNENSKVSTQVSIINRSNALHYMQSRSKRAVSLNFKPPKHPSFNPTPAPLQTSASNNHTENLLAKIKKVFTNFKSQHEDILRDFNDKRRRKMKGLLVCPRLNAL